MKEYSAIIPVYNEVSRVSDVLSAVLRCSEISEIICVDDGSDDGSYELIRDNFSSITLIKHDNNKGKSETIFTGLKMVKNDSILLIDSDLVNLKSKEISEAIKLFEKNNLDCLLLSTTAWSFIDTLFRFLFIVPLKMAGNRIIKRNDLLDIFEKRKPNGYQLEIAQNIYFLNNTKKVARLDISAVNVWKLHKRGLIHGTISDFKMWQGIVKYAGWKMFLKQTYSFAKNKVYF